MSKINKQVGAFLPSKEIVKLDKKNQKLISLLLQDATQTLTELSKELNISKSNVSRRISLLEKQSVINGYQTVIDVSKLGLNSGLLLLQTNLNMEDKEKFIQNISKMSSVYSLIELTGKYDLLVSFYYKEDKDNIVEEIIPTGTIKDFKFAKIKTYFPRIDYNREIFSKNNLVDYKNLKVNVDERDIEILGVIANNCRQSKVNLGEKLKISRETVNYRLKKLIESGVIAKFQASVNPFVLGFESYFLKIKLLKPTQRKKIISFLNQSLRCNTILSSDSLWDVATFIHFKSHQEFREFEGLLLKHYKEAIQEYSFEYVKRQYKLDWLGMVFGSNSIHFYR